MEKMTMEKLNDLCDGNVMNHISMKCPGHKGNGCANHSGCMFFMVPTTCIDDMWKYVERVRCTFCEVPIDDVMDMLKGV